MVTLAGQGRMASRAGGRDGRPAQQAKNRDLELQAAEIRLRAERRIGELMAAQRESGLMADGRFKSDGGSVSDPPSLADAGIDKHLADTARKLAAVPDTFSISAASCCVGPLRKFAL